MKPKILEFFLDFMRVGVIVGFGKTLQKANKAVDKKYKHATSLHLPDNAKALTIGHSNGAQTLLFSYDCLEITSIYHECLHATINIFRDRGIELCEGSEEAYTYHTDMLVKEIIRFCEENDLVIRLA